MTTSGLDDALRGLAAARRLELASAGQRREQLRHVANVVTHRIGQAIQAGASRADIAAALGVSVSRARDRIRDSRRAELVAAPVQPAKVWLDVPRCARPSPPPWPVSRRCRLAVGHDGDHDFSRL